MHATELNLSKLSDAERIQLAEDLRDGVATSTGDLELPAAQKAEIDRRLVDFGQGPSAGEPRDVVRARIANRPAQAGRRRADEGPAPPKMDPPHPP